MRHADIQAAFLSDWDAQDFGLQTILPQRTAAPTNDHVRLNYLPAGNDVSSLGADGSNEVTGIFQADLCFRTGRGNGEILTQIDTISTAYPTGRRISHGGQEVIIRGASVSAPRSENGWLVASISINFSAYVRRQP